MRAALEAAAAGVVPDDLRVEYTDTQPLWGGGVTVRLGPGGAYERVDHPQGPPAAVEPVRRRLDPEEVRAVARLLVEIAVWEPRLPDRPARPDETMAWLTVRCGGERAGAMEFAREMERNDRLARVRDLLVRLGDAGSA